MTAHVLSAAPADRPPPAARRPGAWLAPGLALLRGRGFAAKAAWVSVAFLVPIVFMTVALWQLAAGSIAFTRDEREGLATLRVVLPVLDAAQNRRRAATAGAPDLDAAHQRVEQAMAALATRAAEPGALLDGADAWRQLRERQAAIGQRLRAATPAETFAAHSAVVDAVLTLVVDVADRSNLTLDPEADTYYLMDAAVFRQPVLAEVLGRMRGLGNAALRAGSLPLAQRDTVAAAAVQAEALATEMRTSLAKAAAADPRLKDELRVDDATQAVDGFIRLARTQLLGDAPAGDADAFVAEANRTIASTYAAGVAVMDALDRRLVERIAEQRADQVTKLVVSVAAVAFAFYLMAAFYRLTQAGIADVTRHLERIAAGDLSGDPRPSGRDELSRLMVALAGTVASLRTTVGEVRRGVVEIQHASDEVASASMDLSKRTEDTAAELQRTSATMTEIGTTVQATAETARGAAELVERNAAVAGRGGTVVGDAVATMGRIRDASGRIADIIGTIDGIAFQTNILALNAAVEAARAGEQGRGFAVVAGEVRALAGRSAEAAREIKVLIGASVEQVESGASVVGQAGDTMREIVDSAVRVKGLIGEISQGTGEQTSALQDVGRAVDQLDAMTQQNAALVEQTAAAAASLRDSAQRLARAMDVFRLPPA